MNSGSSEQMQNFSKTTGQGMHLVVYAGPTGGHIFPAQSFCEGFRARFPESRIDLVTSLRAKPLIDQMPPEVFHSVSYIPEFGFSKIFSLRTLKLLFLLLRAAE